MQHVQKDYLDSFTDARGDHYFVPYSTGPMGLIYNAKAFQDAGLDPNKPPKTWEELLEYAKKLTRDGKYGIGLFGKGDNSSVWRLWYWWMSNGAEVLTADGKKSAINSPAFIEAIDFWADLYRKHKVAPPSVPANSFGENNQLLAQGVVAMVESGVWQFGVTEKINPAIKGQLRAAPMPKRKVDVAVGGGTDALCITAGSNSRRMMNASMKIAAPKPTPIMASARSLPIAKAPKTAIMMIAAAVTTRPVMAKPWRAAYFASPVRTHSSCMRETRNTS